MSSKRYSTASTRSRRASTASSGSFATTSSIGSFDTAEDGDSDVEGYAGPEPRYDGKPRGRDYFSVLQEKDIPIYIFVQGFLILGFVVSLGISLYSILGEENNENMKLAAVASSLVFLLLFSLYKFFEEHSFSRLAELEKAGTFLTRIPYNERLKFHTNMFGDPTDRLERI